jgi:hypothetical protein
MVVIFQIEQLIQYMIIIIVIVVFTNQAPDRHLN